MQILANWAGTVSYTHLDVYKRQMLLMLFIVGHLAWQSKAGKFGTMILFLALALGMVGYVAKSLIQYNLGI